MNIGERIRKRRKGLELSVDDVALAIDKNRTTIYRYESGYIEDLPTSVLEPLARALYTTPEYLMGWTDDPIDYEDILECTGDSIPAHFRTDLDHDERCKEWVESRKTVDTDHENEEKKTWMTENHTFTNVDDAMLFIIQNPTVAAHGGYDIDRMTDEDKIEFANQIADTIKFFGQKYKK